jgi:hypothetical protein
MLLSVLALYRQRRFGKIGCDGCSTAAAIDYSKAGRAIPTPLPMAAIRIVDIRIGGLVAGWGNAERGYAMDLDDVEDWLNKEMG